MGRLKILMLGWEFPPIINGGLGVACLGMAKALSKVADVSIILPKTDPNFIVENVELIGLNNVDVEALKSQFTTSVYQSFETVSYIPTELMPYSFEEAPLTRGKATATKTVTKKDYTKEQLEDVSDLNAFKSGDLYGEDVNKKVMQFAKYAARLASKMDFDIIHAHDWMTFLAGVEIKKRTGKPLAVHVHSLSYDRSGPNSRGWLYDIEKYGMEQADLVIPVSNYTGQVCEYHFGINRYKIFPVHNGALEVKPFKTEKAFPGAMVLFLGRLTEQKGPEYFLEIASKVLKKDHQVHFVMAGTGDKMKPLIESGAFHHVGDKFHFTGFLNKEKVNELLSMTDVYCMPSVSEPFGLSALEAAQFGIPAVISKQSGVAEVLHGALQADFWDTDLMAKHITDLISNQSLRKRVVKAGYEDLELLTWDFAAEKIINIFDNYLQH